jgi:DNA-binding NarL/FixJ family response regulator
MQTPIRVLLVEQNDAHALLARTCLSSDEPPGEAPVEVTHARTLAEALKHLRRRDHQAIVLELALPDAVRLDALRPIVRAAPSVPVVVLTAYEDELMAAAAIGFGAHDYLVKQQLVYLSLPRVVRHAVARNQLTRRLADSQGAVSISALGASLTHEINNALAYVSSNLDFLAENLAELAQKTHGLEAPGHPVDEGVGSGLEFAEWFKMVESALGDARHGASRIGTVIATLRDFSLQNAWDGSRGHSASR